MVDLNFSLIDLGSQKENHYNFNTKPNALRLD